MAIPDSASDDAQRKVRIQVPAGVKRKYDQANPAGPNRPRTTKAVKRRASKACQCCRARKVRCNVVEQIPCTNCRLDEVECIISESKRKRKPDEQDEQDESHLESPTYDSFALQDNDSFALQDNADYESPPEPEHRPHSLYDGLNSTESLTRRRTMSSTASRPNAMPQHPQKPLMIAPRQTSPRSPSRHLPCYLKPLPARIGPDEVTYLSAKGALTIPPNPLRNALLKCFIEFVHPFMPLLDLEDMVDSIDGTDGERQISLLLFQAIMFSGVANVDMRFLKAAGYATRRQARRDFFQKTRLLYDFDYEADRISLIQSLLLMTYWYETPDDQKDSHHWMGIAVSLSHTIGLHRNPERSNMDPNRRKLWKRIWWSTYMRDRLIALGMRRPTRIKNEDFDVPLLTLEDFSIFQPDLSKIGCVPLDCTVFYNAAKQRHLAIMCLEKAKLCVCISHVLSAQYSVLHNNHGIQSKEGSTQTTMMLVAKKDDPEVCAVHACDKELRHWRSSIDAEADVLDPNLLDFDRQDESIFINRAMLHMVYYATLSALHRPQVLPSGAWPSENTATELLNLSRINVRLAANQITAFAEVLAKHDLVRLMPTVGITVLLPAIIIHLLDIKAPEELTRRASLQGFCQCMQIMSRLRDIYAAADYSTAFLEAAIRKAEIALPQKAASDVRQVTRVQPPGSQRIVFVKDPNVDPALLNGAGGDKLNFVPTPPPDGPFPMHDNQPQLSEADVATRISSFLADTPPGTNVTQASDDDGGVNGLFDMADFEPDFDALVNLDAAGEAFALDVPPANTTGGNGAGKEGGFTRRSTEGLELELDNVDGQSPDSLPTPPSPRRAQKLKTLAACSVLNLPIWGFAMNYGIFQDFYLAQGYSDSVGIIGTTSNGIMYMSMPFLFASLSRRWANHRRLVAYAGVLLSCLGFLLSAFGTQVWQLVLCQGIIAPLGCAMVYSPTMLSLNENYADRNRAFAYGITLSAKSIVGASCPFLFSHLLQTYDVRTTMLVWIAIIAGAALPCVSLMSMNPTNASAAAPYRPRRIPWAFLAHPAIYVTCLATALQSAGYGIPQTYLNTYASTVVDLSSASSTLLLVLFNAPGIFSSTFFGLLSDSALLSATSASSISALGSALAAWLLWGTAGAADVHTSLPLLVVFAVTFGFFAGGYSATWGGAVKDLEAESAARNEAVDAGVVYGLLNGARGVGYVGGGLVGVQLLKVGEGGAGVGGAAYGTVYGPLIVFTGLSTAMGGLGLAWKCGKYFGW